MKKAVRGYGDRRDFPPRFGAGIKGKIVDTWAFGLPVVTTFIGSDGMWSVGDEWGRIVADTVDQ
jgi:hypothetical protein